jgi:hypothetical protein
MGVTNKAPEKYKVDLDNVIDMINDELESIAIMKDAKERGILAHENQIEDLKLAIKQDEGSEKTLQTIKVKLMSISELNTDV